MVTKNMLRLYYSGVLIRRLPGPQRAACPLLVMVSALASAGVPLAESIEVTYARFQPKETTRRWINIIDAFALGIVFVSFDLKGRGHNRQTLCLRSPSACGRQQFQLSRPSIPAEHVVGVPCIFLVNLPTAFMEGKKSSGARLSVIMFVGRIPFCT